MQKIFFTLMLLVWLVPNTWAQTYFVDKVKGKVSVNGKVLKEEDTFKASDKLVFGTEDAEIRIETPNELFITIKGSDAKKSNLQEVASTLIALLGIDKTRTTASAKGTVVSLEHLKKFLAADDTPPKVPFSGVIKPFLIIGEVPIVLPSSIVLDDSNFVMIRFIYTGKTTLTEDGKEYPTGSTYQTGVRSEGTNKFILSTNSFSIGDTKLTLQDMKAVEVFKINKKDESIMLLKGFQPILFDKDDATLKADVQRYLNRQKSKGITKGSDLYEKIFNYLTQCYGMPDTDNLKAWLKEAFGIDAQN